MVSTYRIYVLLIAFVYIQVYFLFEDMYIRARFTSVYAYMCDYSGKCMVITYSKGKDQPGKDVSPARGQLAERENELSPVPVRA